MILISREKQNTSNVTINVYKMKRHKIQQNSTNNNSIYVWIPKSRTSIFTLLLDFLSEVLIQILVDSYLIDWFVSPTI